MVNFYLLAIRFFGSILIGLVIGGIIAFLYFLFHRFLLKRSLPKNVHEIVKGGLNEKKVISKEESRGATSTDGNGNIYRQGNGIERIREPIRSSQGYKRLEDYAQQQRGISLPSTPPVREHDVSNAGNQRSPERTYRSWKKL